MINVAHFRAAIEHIAGDVVMVPKVQLAQLLAEVDTGQHARRALTNLKTITAVAASQSGAPA